MLACSVLALCAVAGVIGVTTANTATTQNRDRRSTFLDIVKERPSSESSYKFPVLPAELPIQLGGHGGVNIPVLVLPVPIPVYTKSDSCDAHLNKPVPDEKAEVTPQYILPPYVATRYHEDVATANQQLTTYTEQKLDDSQMDYSSAKVVIPDPLPPHKPGNRLLPNLVDPDPPLTNYRDNYNTRSIFPDPPPARKPPSRHPPQSVTTDPPPTSEPVSNYTTGSLIPDVPPARKPPSRHPPEFVTTPPPITEPVSNYATGSLIPDLPPARKPPSRHLPQLVTTDPPPITELVSNYATGSLIPDLPPARKLPSRHLPQLVTTDPPPITEPVSNYATGSLIPDLPPARKLPSRHLPQLVTTDPPPTTEPVSNYATGSLIPDLPPARKLPSRHLPQLVTADPPPITKPVSNYATGSLIPDLPPARKLPSRHLPQLVTTDPPPTTEPVSNYATGSLIPDLPPARKLPSRHLPQLVTTDPPPTTEPVSNYATGSLIPDLPPARKLPSRHLPQLVTTDPPPITEPVSNYVTGTLIPDPLPSRKPPSRQPSEVTTDPPTSELVNSYVIESLFPDTPSDRKHASRLPASLVTTESPSTSNPNYITGALLTDLPPRKPMENNGRLNLGTGDRKIHFTASDANYVIDETQQRGHFEELVGLSAKKYRIPNLQQPSHTSHMMPTVINKEENLEHVVEEGQIPYSEGRGQIFATTDELIQSFRQESSNAPELPAVIPRGRRFPDRIPPTEADGPPKTTIFAPSPPRPDFSRSLRLRIDLTVPRSDYTEAYDIEWHAESNTARTVIEDDATTLYRVPLVDGRIQYLKVQKDSLNGTVVRRCTTSPLLTASPEDKTFPGLPDLSVFHFVGYTAAEGWSLVELWRHWVIGKHGEGGAARGESLNFSHDFLMYRDGGDAMPLKYTVVTHSSVLGPACDSYTHRYLLLPESTSPKLPDITQCDVIEELKEKKRQRRDITGLVSREASAVWGFFNPIGDFLGLTRPAKYDSMFNEFKDKFKRNYRDKEEEAVRKQQFIKTNRFVEAANRIADTFKTGINFMADRVKEELRWLFGAVPPPPGTAPPPEASPEFDFAAAINMAEGLPDEFDWRSDRSFESPVRHQGTKCMSCWAFAVAGATEGALYNTTKQIVPLSTQTMVDCGKPKYNVMGCEGGWPVDAFGYVKDHGLPAWDDYTYEEQEQQCKVTSVGIVTHISEYHTVTKSEEALKVVIYNRAPTVVVLRANADSFINFNGVGVLDDTRCSKQNDHAVLAIGWGLEPGSHFIIKNSWGDLWGDKGYARVANDHCGITDYASYPVVKKPDIDRADLQASVE